MTEKNTGGPAFPCDPASQSFSGINLRDYFAAKAMQGMLSGSGLGFMGIHPSYWDSLDGASKTAYQIADAMLEARK